MSYEADASKAATDAAKYVEDVEERMRYAELTTGESVTANLMLAIAKALTSIALSLRAEAHERKVNG